MTKRHFDYETKAIEPPLYKNGSWFPTEIVRVQATEMEPAGARVFIFQSEDEAEVCLEVLRG